MKYYLILSAALFFIFQCEPLIAKTLLFGDSLTAIYGNSYRNLVDNNSRIEYVSGSGLIINSKKDWLAFVNNADLREYDTIIISLGTNDFVKYNSAAGEAYYRCIFILISEIQKQNSLAMIIWLAPPHLKNRRHEKYLVNTRHIIKHSANLLGVKYIDVNQSDILGIEWQSVIQGQQVRTDDGIHITALGGDRIIERLVKSLNKGY
ncbi:SGNH/GDSL hydrolase family protein [Providencia hangzhouensis]|uniref:SGNH/GDSL hydrolase family protein n=1 Tax=Providencia hangzhouensis TaxID=3031799 RepID=UPI0034DD0F47